MRDLETVKGQIRIIAETEEEAYELAGYLNRITGGAVVFHRPHQGRFEWLAYGDIELPPGEDTRRKGRP